MAEGAAAGGGRVALLDKRGERRQVAAHASAVAAQLAACQDPPAALSLAVPLIVSRVRACTCTRAPLSINPMTHRAATQWWRLGGRPGPSCHQQPLTVAQEGAVATLPPRHRAAPSRSWRPSTSSPA